LYVSITDVAANARFAPCKLDCDTGNESAHLIDIATTSREKEVDNEMLLFVVLADGRA
jgi:hypothetical protein